MNTFRQKYIGPIPGAQIVFPISPWLQFYSKDGTKLHTYFFPSRCQSPKATIILLHGFTAYADLSSFMADALADYCHVLAFDQRGSGRSQGRRIQINNFQDLIQDSLDFTLLVHRTFNLPIFLHGQSMGGCLSILIAAQLSDIISGIMLQAPAILASTPKNNCLSCFLSCFGCFCPCLTIGERIGDGVENVTRNSYVRNFVMEDEFMYKGKANLKTVKNIVKGMRQASRCAESVKCRVIIFFGTDDRVTDIESAKEFLTRVGTEDSRLIELKDARHFLMTEPDIFYIKEVTMEWLIERL